MSSEKNTKFFEKNFGSNISDTELLLEQKEQAEEENFSDKNSIEEIFDKEYSEGIESGEELKIAEDTIYDLQKLSATERGEPHTTTVRMSGKDYPVLISETVGYLARHLLKHNEINGYSLVTLIGKSGTGKSTFTQTLAHITHTQATKIYKKHYAVDWFRKKEIESLDKIIASMEKGVNRIIVFEDASYVFNDKKESEIEEVMAKLTYIRHTLQANVIVIVQIHYSKALEKFLRDGDLKILTSISDEEIDNYLRLFGFGAKFVINLFARKFHSMNVEGYYYSMVGTSKVYKYYTKAPFKLALVSDFGIRHFTQYHKASCELCEPNFERSQNKAMTAASLRDFLHDMLRKYSYETSRLSQAFHYHFFYAAGIDMLKPRERTIIRSVVQYLHDNPDDYKSLVEQFQNGKTFEGVLRDYGLIQKTITREEMSKLRKVDKRKKKEIEKALKERRKKGEQIIDTAATPTAEQVNQDTKAVPIEQIEGQVTNDGSGLAVNPLDQQKEMTGETSTEPESVDVPSTNDIEDTGTGELVDLEEDTDIDR